jgi:anti-sigma regulatory factor (Ser/Thr protein kinase)
MAEDVRLSIPSDPKYLCLLRSVVENMLRCMEFSDTERTRTVLALDEAVTNIIRHSCGCDPDIKVDVLLKSTDLELIVEVRDFGDCGADFDITKTNAKVTKDVTPGGFGVNIIKTVMDSVEYTSSKERGNLLVMRKKIK